MSQPAFVRAEEIELREAGLNGQDVSGGAHEAIGRPSQDFVPECGELPGHVDRGNKDVRAIAEDGKDQVGGQPVAEEGGGGPTLAGESRLTATKAAWALASLLTKWGVVEIEGVNQ